MARLIEADALFAVVQRHHDLYKGATNPADKARRDECLQVMCDINDAPTVDAEPVKHGRWVTYPECLAYDGAYSDTHMVCSECKYVWDIMDNATETFDYCPHCGAKMDGGEHDETD